MQEYLNTNTYEYKLAHSKPDGEWVCIPEVADFYVRSKTYKDNFFFCKDSLGIIETYDTMLENSWHKESTLTTQNLSENYEILWVRPTQPEALPFIDDNPQSLNEQYAEIEQVRQAIKVKSGSNSDHAADAMAYGFMGAKQMCQHKHYFKDVSHLNEIDVYIVLKLFNVTDPCLQHIVKKALCAGQRGHKDLERDLKDILDTAKRAVDINKTC